LGAQPGLFSNQCENGRPAERFSVINPIVAYRQGRATSLEAACVANHPSGSAETTKVRFTQNATAWLPEGQLLMIEFRVSG